MTKNHCQSGTKLHYIWIEMRRRCRAPKHPKFHHYGGRGIKVCEEWEDFESFFAWSKSNGYKEGLTIDRIDNDRGYEPENCRWTTQLRQTNNTRNTIRLSYKGRTQSLADWARELDLNYYTLRSRVRIGWEAERIIETPMEGRNHDRNKSIGKRKQG